MRDLPIVAGDRFVAASDLDRVAGLLGCVSFELGLLALQGGLQVVLDTTSGPRAPFRHGSAGLVRSKSSE